ncbi:YhhN-like protein [Parasitella parasitica]|nr:YhhN-like protein [Parasitella parasitica]
MFTKFAKLSSVLYFYFIYTNSVYAKYILKPITTLLIIGVDLQSNNAQNNAKLAGLIFSLLGDIFLMFDGEDKFILGLACFLIAHIFYIYTFYETKKRDQASFLLGLFSTALVYFSFLYKSIFQEGGIVMTVAVAVYIVVITLMVYYGFMNNNTKLSVGVLLFFISDATLALDKFLYHAPDRRCEYIVMFTYYTAQFCIARYY